MRRSEYLHRLLKAILFVMIFIVITIIFDSAFEYNESSTENMLTLYSRQKEIDTVFVGNSAGEMLDAKLYTDLTTDRAYNMCTPSQGLSVSLKNIKMAASQHRINKAVLLLTFDSVEAGSYEWIDHLYDRVVYSASPLYVQLGKMIARNSEKSFSPDNIKTEHSINVWIPWEMETDHGLKNVRDNLAMRIERLIQGNRLGSNIAYDLNKRIYQTYPGTLTDQDIYMLQKDIETMSSLKVAPGMISEDKIELLAEICTFCRDNEIDLYVIVTPHRSDYYDKFDDFREYSENISSYLDDFVTKRNFVYYDTEHDPRLHDTLPDEYFYDWEHIYDDHKEQATNYLASMISTLQ